MNLRELGAWVHRRERVLAGAALVAVVGLYAWFFINAARRIGTVKPGGLATGDFEHFYYGARALLDGTHLYSSGHGGYIYPPLLAFLYMPAARLDLNSAAAVLLVVNMVLGLLAALAMARACVDRLGAPARWTAVVLVGAGATVLALDKLKGEYQMWQTNTLVALCFAGALWQLDRRPWVSGLALGLAFNIKYLPIVALPYLLARRRWSCAAWFVAGIIGFAFLPALVTGWNEHVENLRVAFAGLARLVGLDAGAGATANIDGITAPYSVSITSALARALGEDRGYAPGGGSGIALVAAAILGASFLAAIGWMYRARGLALWAWPAEQGQRGAAFRALVAVEWAGLLIAVLAFGPQTNMRHMSLLMLAFAPGACLVLYGAAGVARWPLVLGTAVLVLGITLPPGGERFAEAVRAWHRVGGPAACALVYFATLVWAGLSQARAMSAAGVERSVC